MQKCLSCTCGYKFRIISPTAIIPTRGLNLDVFPKDITVEGNVKRHIHHNFLMIRGLQVRWWKEYYLQDKIVSRLTDSFSCRATFQPAQSSMCLFYNFPVTFHHVTPSPPLLLSRILWRKAKNQDKIVQILFLNFIGCGLMSDCWRANISHEIWLHIKILNPDTGRWRWSVGPGSRLSGREWQRSRNQGNLKRAE